MSRLGPLVLLLALLGRCGGGASAPIRTHMVPLPPRVRVAQVFLLRPGEKRTFPPGALQPGDRVACTVGGHRLHVRIPNRPYGGWSIGTAAATASGGSSELRVSSRSDGSVVARCGHRNS